MNESPLKLETILVPVDFSATSEKTLACAVTLARRFRAKITLLHVVMPLPYPVDMQPVPGDQSMAVRSASRALDALAKKSVPAALRGRSIVSEGVPYETIFECARSGNADLVVIGTHGRSDFAHIFMGSTAERVVRHATCPVLVVRGR
jgi:nucleotide-binding universal stress UspA family protein